MIVFISFQGFVRIMFHYEKLLNTGRNFIFLSALHEADTRRQSYNWYYISVKGPDEGFARVDAQRVETLLHLAQVQAVEVAPLELAENAVVLVQVGAQ